MRPFKTALKADIPEHKGGKMSLTAKERVLRVLNGEETDALPVISVCQYATYGLMEKTGASWPEAHFDGVKMAELSKGGVTVLGLDAVRVPYCQTVEAEIFGAVLKDGGKTHIPSVDNHPYKIGDEPLIPENFVEKGRIPEILKAVRILKKEVGEETAVLGSIVGAFSVATSLVGIPPMLKATFKAPESIEPYLETAEQTAEQYAKAMVEAGADAIVIEDMMASLDMISPKTYRNLAAPYEKRLIDAIDVPVILHICGKLDAVMSDIADTGANAISVESSVDIPKARENFAERGIKTPIIGAVHPIKALLEGDKSEVEAQVKKSIRDGVACISPGCAVAPDTPIENIVAMVDAVRGS